MVLRIYVDHMSQPARALMLFVRANKLPAEEVKISLLKREFSSSCVTIIAKLDIQNIACISSWTKNARVYKNQPLPEGPSIGSWWLPTVGKVWHFGNASHASLTLEFSPTVLLQRSDSEVPCQSLPSRWPLVPSRLKGSSSRRRIHGLATHWTPSSNHESFSLRSETTELRSNATNSSGNAELQK